MNFYYKIRDIIDILLSPDVNLAGGRAVTGRAKF